MLDKVIANKARKIDEGHTLNVIDAGEIELELRRFAIDQIPNTLALSNFQGSGATPTSSVPLTAEGIQYAMQRAADAEDAKAKQTAKLWGLAASTLIQAGVVALTGGTLSPVMATNLVGNLRGLVPD
jgi:hypothetical protein